jgi:hypothetical protein
MPEPAKKKRFALPREVRIILSVGSLVFVFEYFVLPQFSSARNSLHLLASLNPLLVTIAVLFEMAAIYAYVELTRSVLYPHAPGRFNLLRVNLAGLAISHVVPGGTAPAGALSYRIFSELGVPKETSAFGLAVQGSGSAVVLNMIFWLALVVSIPLRGFNPAYGFAALAGVFLLAAFFGTILLITRGQRWAANWLRFVAGHGRSREGHGPARQGGRPHHDARQQPAHALGRVHVGGAQLAVRRRVPVGLHLVIRQRHLADRPARRLRPGQRPRRHPHHPCRAGRD